MRLTIFSGCVLIANAISQFPSEYVLVIGLLLIIFGAWDAIDFLSRRGK